MPDPSGRRHTAPGSTPREARRPSRPARALRSALLAAALLAAAPAAAQQVQVRFAPPLTYTDAGNGARPGPSPRGTTTELTRIFEFLGKLYLRPGDSLDVTVLDVDLAGIGSLGYGVAGGPRVVTAATPPRIRLAYLLRRGGRVVARGTETVTNPNFLALGNPRFSSGPLYYERRILTDWFEERFRYGRGLG
ncbi:DUF3016 domain-containing protein [Methylobacterium sp. NEAU 140]|uniref:DUF3016 domain-containing protein n=1 Tax=Methylobacterium sp. NEAU 140 TaxID=3064945 RepID=UPI0027333E34|nr:DUF3016 domain-containing protein [Methylobacterium sp. NEAU 140]MDP4024105.1 DUF3016 domain-containing protein [Methylobacterium sp. NEAU 140]